MLSPESFYQPGEVYLSDLSERDRPWDGHRWESGLVGQMYRLTAGREEFDRYAERMDDCSRLLDFVLKSDDLGEVKFKLQAARFCRVRHCAVCQWRRSMMWRARFFRVVPEVLAAYPDNRFIFLTLTVSNPELIDLRLTIDLMAVAWKRLVRLKLFPAVGFVRSLEVTRPKNDYAHPHFHCLLMVPGSYFKSRSYLNKAKWVELWRRSLRVEYSPSVHVRAVKPRYAHTVEVEQSNAHTPESGQKDVPVVEISEELQALQLALLETLKYSVKPGDFIRGAVLDKHKDLVSGNQVNQSNAEWLHELTRQMHNVRSLSVGGVLRKFLSEADPEDLIHPEGEAEEEVLDSDLHMFFGWREQVKKYAHNA